MNNLRKAFLFFLVLFIAYSQNIQVFPTSTYLQVTASSRACFANCQFCQIKTGFCQQCLAPYFQKNQNGACVLVQGYIIESSLQELSTGQAFTPSNVSWNTVQTTLCQPSSTYFQQTLEILGPFNQATGSVQYVRSVSTHKYMQLKFFLLQMNWNIGDSLKIVIRNQNNIILSNQTIQYLNNVPKEQLCSSSPFDQRYSVQYSFVNTDSTNIFVSFTPEFAAPSTQWGMSTFLLLTGRCHESCDDCFASNEPTQCRNCRDFFIQGSDGTCNQCSQGFRLDTLSGISRCQKCPIQLKTCQPNNLVCYYNDFPSVASQLTSSCKFNANNYYISEYFVNEQSFAGSLFSVGGSSSTYQCAQYSMVGLANRGESISRIFSSVQSHTSASLYFNIFIIDQQISSRSVFQIYIDNRRVETLFINTRGVSSICGGSNPEVFQTYPATRFFPHTNTQNVNITIVSSNTANWGIRNFRMSYKVCDQSCLECGTNGCLTCAGIFNLYNLTCTQCPSGSSPAVYSPQQCFSCGQYCRACLIDKNEAGIVTSKCQVCQQGYYSFQGICQRLPNVGLPVPQVTVKTVWSSTNDILENATCSIDYTQTAISNQRSVDFLVGQDNLKSQFTIQQTHHKMLISFYLIKIDEWAQGDQIHLYLNDLLVVRKSYSSFGNRICFTQTQNDFVSYEQIQLQDNNETLTAYFQVVRADGSVSTIGRKFGISQFRVHPVGCKQCDNYNFEFKVQYNYDDDLIVQVIFNRLYINNNPSEFKKIFKLEVNGIQRQYQIIKNDSIRYFLSSYLVNEVLLENITVKVKYPQRVTTDITDPINEQAFFPGRLMQQQQSSSISKIKSLSNSQSSIVLERYTPLEYPESVDGVKTFFQVITRVVIYAGFFSFFIGCITPCTHFMHNMQKIWVHIFVAALTIPNFLRVALLGFRESQDINIAINPTQWQVGIPQYLYYDAPAQYQDYYHDITYFRNIYSIGFAAALYLLFSVIMYVVMKRKVVTQSSGKFIRHLKITFYRRPFFVLNSVIFYQFFTTCLASTMQFIDLESNTNEDPFRGINAAATIISFILATVYPLVHFFYLSYKEKDLYSGDLEISYRNRYHQIFYRFLPKNLWKSPNYEFRPIGFAQRFYNLLRFGQLWWYAIVVSLMYNSPFAQAFLLLIMNFLHLFFIVISHISFTKPFKYLKSLQLLFFVGLEIIIIVTYSQNQTLTTDAYRTLGIVGVVFIFMIVIFSLLRFIYTFVKLLKQYNENTNNKDTKIDERLRNDDFYNSFENINASQRIVSDD